MNNNKLMGRLYDGYKEPFKFFGRYLSFGGQNSNTAWKVYQFTYSKNRIDIKTKHKLLYPEFSFLKGDIVSIEPYKIKTTNSKYAIIIKHKVKFYYPYMIFMFSGNNTPELLIDNIIESGYFNQDISSLDKKTTDEIKKIQSGSLKPTNFLWFYILVIIIFIVFYFVFNWHFLDKILLS